tara:strand:+ start:92 stop:277 length:186 start_codon:yes stop_codon:yes gene_type:complete
MGSIIKVGNKYRAIVRIGEFRLNPIPKHISKKKLAKNSYYQKIETLGSKHNKDINYSTLKS